MKEDNIKTGESEAINEENEINSHCNLKKNKINEDNELTENTQPKIKKLIIYPISRIILIFFIIILCFVLFILINMYYNRLKYKIKSNNEKTYVDKFNNMINNQNLEIKSSNIIRITHTQNETLVYKRIKNISILMEVNSENSTHNISIISYVLFHVYDIILKETGNNIYYGNILVLNSTIYYDNNIYPQGGINIIQDFEEEYEFYKNYSSEFIDNSEEDEENLSNITIPIINFSFYSNGTILEKYFANELNENMINILNESLYDIIPDISTSSNLRILLSKENGYYESKFQKERNELLYFNGNHMKNSSINRISNHTINNEIEKITRINTIGQAILINNQNNNNNLNERKKSNNIPNGISKMIINESSTSTLVLSSINETINEIILELNNDTNYTTNLNEENLSFKLVNNLNEYRQLSNFEYNKFKKNYSYSYEIFSTNLYDVDIKLNLNIQTNLSPSKIIVQGIFTLGSNEYLLFDHFIKTNTDEVLSRYLKESNQIKKILDEKCENLRIIIKKDWTKQIKELLEQLTTPLESIYDISNLYNELLEKILKIFVDSSKNIFKEMEYNLLNNKKILENISYNLLKKNYEIINNMFEDIRNQYLNYLLSNENNILKIQNIFSEFLNENNDLSQEITIFDPIIYDIQTQLSRPIDILKFIERNALTSIKNKVYLMNKTLINYQNEFIGNELYNLEFLINNLTSSLVLQEGISIEEREYFKQILKSIIEEINKQTNIIYSQINDRYIKDKERYITNFTNNIHNNITLIVNQSIDSINNIKKQIENIEFMELYVKHLNILDSIENKLLLEVNSQFFDIFLKYENLLIYNLNEDNFIKMKENELYLASNNILENIKNEISEIKLKLYNKKLNLAETHRLNLGELAYFLIEKVTKEVLQVLLNDYYKYIDSIYEKIQNRNNDNYKLLKQYLKKVVDAYNEDHKDRWRRKYVSIDKTFNNYRNVIEDYENWVKNNFESKMKELDFLLQQ